jgi:hypothetical protein
MFMRIFFYFICNNLYFAEQNQCKPIPAGIKSLGSALT